MDVCTLCYVVELVLDTLSAIFSTSLYLIRISWWVLIPLIVIIAVRGRWAGWLEVKTGKKLEWVLLEIVPPPEVLKTPLAMENVLLGLAGGWTEMNKRDIYWRGSFQDIFSLEIVCNDRAMRFLIRCQRKQIGWVQSKFYAQYPEAEIREVEDYVSHLPEIVPNESWDMWGGVYTLVKRDKNKNPLWVLPLRTYIDWENPEDDRRISPLSQLGEASLTLGKNEYIIIQMIISPRVTEPDVKGKAQEHIDELVGRSQPKKGGGVVGFMVDFVGNFMRGLNAQEMQWSGEEKTEEQNRFEQSPMWTMTEGERDRIKAIEMKESKMKFETTMHCMYLYKKGEEHKERISDMNGFLRQFGNESLNGLRPKSGTYPSSNATFFNKTRCRLRMRRLFFAFRTRWMGYLGDSYILNVEEIASIYHLPGTIAQSSGIPRVQSKMTAPPRELPQ